MQAGSLEVVGDHLGPGASELFTQGLRCRYFSTTFFASRPAAIITLGLEVLVQEVMAAITTAPFFAQAVGSGHDVAA